MNSVSFITFFFISKAPMIHYYLNIGEPKEALYGKARDGQPEHSDHRDCPVGHSVQAVRRTCLEMHSQGGGVVPEAQAAGDELNARHLLGDNGVRMGFLSVLCSPQVEWSLS
jgi:hypothetical protein